jgi:hypothetical protein
MACAKNSDTSPPAPLIELFGERGYAAIAIRDIAERANVGRTTLSPEKHRCRLKRHRGCWRHTGTLQTRGRCCIALLRTRRVCLSCGGPGTGARRQSKPACALPVPKPTAPPVRRAGELSGGGAARADALVAGEAPIPHSRTRRRRSTASSSRQSAMRSGEGAVRGHGRRSNETSSAPMCRDPDAEVGDRPV